MKVTVFGGAHPRPGEPAYEEALRLGRLLGQAGHTVLTGGYIGTMEAVSRGAAETGAHVIGVTCEEIERWRSNRANSWVKEERRYPTLHDRLIALSDGCDAALALPGGAGTLAEISMLWNRLLIDAVPPKPLILIGMAWKNVFEQLFIDQSLYIKENDRKWLQFADTVETAVSMLSQG
jgi:uncharacterized protein (TIGR00730 family)